MVFRVGLRCASDGEFINDAVGAREWDHVGGALAGAIWVCIRWGCSGGGVAVGRRKRGERALEGEEGEDGGLGGSGRDSGPLVRKC